MANHLLSIHKLSGGYTMKHPVIHDVSFHVEAGEIVGLIGVNGAGKSTIIKHILGLMQPISGKISIRPTGNLQLHTTAKKHIAYIPETPLVYDELTLWEHLELTATAYNIDESIFHRRSKRLLEQFNMVNMVNWFPSEFSKGMKQKVMVMCALLVQPSLLIVDEPFVGLDPLAIHTLLERFVEQKEQGTGLLISTHMLATAEKYCDRFIILHEGRIVLSGTLTDIRQTLDLPQATLNELFLHVVRGSTL